MIRALFLRLILKYVVFKKTENSEDESKILKKYFFMKILLKKNK